jgi:GST-like protein
VELHFAPTPNGWKVTLLLEESGIPYAVVPVDMAAGDQHRPTFLAMSPNGRMPALRDPNHDACVFESGAIMLHLAERYPEAAPFLPPHERSAALQWLFWVNAGLGPMAGQCSHFLYYAGQVDPAANHAYALDRYKREYDRLVSVLDRRLETTGAFLAGGAYGVADMAAWPWIKPWKRWMGSRSLAACGYPHAYRWYETIKARPATGRALAVLREEARAQQRLREEGGLDRKGLDNMFGHDGSRARTARDD